MNADIYLPRNLDARVMGITNDIRDDAVTAVASQASSNVHRILNERIKKPTPYYETQIRTDRVVNDRVVHDSGVVYGPWLEGVSERNRQTRFKGYHAFGQGAAEVRGQVDALVAPIVAHHLRRI